MDFHSDFRPHEDIVARPGLHMVVWAVFNMIFWIVRDITAPAGLRTSIPVATHLDSSDYRAWDFVPVSK